MSSSLLKVIDRMTIEHTIKVQCPAVTTSPKTEKEREKEAGSTTDVVLCGQGEAVRGTLGPTTVVIERNLTYQVQRKKPDLTSTWTVILMYQQRISPCNPLSIFTELLQIVCQSSASTWAQGQPEYTHTYTLRLVKPCVTRFRECYCLTDVKEELILTWQTTMQRLIEQLLKALANFQALKKSD